MKKFLLIAGLATVLALGFFSGGGTPAKANPGGLQNFNVDMVNCLVPAGADTVSPAPYPALPPVSCGPLEARALGTAVSLSTAIDLPPGDRLGYPYVYNGPGPTLKADTLGDHNTQVGDLLSVVDLFQNGSVDMTADINNTTNGNCPSGLCSTSNGGQQLTFANAAPEQYIEQPLIFGAGTGCPLAAGGNDDETYLNSLMPGVAAMTKYVRYRACIDSVYITTNTPNPGDQFRIDVIASNNGAPTPLNLVTFTPVWSPAGTHVNLVVLSQIADHLSPSSARLGLDSPQSSLSHTNAPYAVAPANPGLYTYWMTEISQPDGMNGALNFVLSTSCKAVGGNFPDADHDCIPDANEGPACIDTGWPTTPAVTIAGNPDSDGDGLPDGVEVAWGSDPCKANTDADGRTDLEEMIGPTQFLTNPTNPDTDGDGVPDGGLKVDLNADGSPDFPDVNGDGVIDAGRQVVDSQADGSSHVRIGYKILGTDIKPDGAGKDNCPSIPNGALQDNQLNTDLDTATTLGNGDLYGNACDTDWDNDGMTNTAEATFKWDPTTNQCGNSPPLAGPATALNPLDPDTDGDGILDGRECELGSNPNNATDVPPACVTDSDTPPDYLCGGAALNNEETFYRTQGISNPSPPPAQLLIAPAGDNNADSDGDTLTDGCEVLLAGTNPMNANTDGDNPAVNDGAEVVGASALAPGLNACDELSTEYTRMGNGASIPGDDTTIANSKGGRTADTDKDGLLNYQDPNPAGGLLANMDYTYDDNGNGIPCFPPTIDGADTGPSWDTNCNGVLDGKEDPVTHLCTFSAPVDQDTDGDGLKDNWEVCKWGTNPNIVDSDSDSVGDCREALDSNGDGTFDFGGDVLNMARAALLPAGITAGHFGRDGDFDLNGNGSIGFGDDVLSAARMAFNIASKPGYPGAPCR